MATVALNSANFQEKVGDGIALVDFWAEWCGPCRAFGPVYERVSEKHPDITFGKVDTQAEQELAYQFQISSIPTVMAVRDGVIVYSEPGALGEQSLESLIQKLRELDMDEIMAKVEAATEAAEAKAAGAKAAGAKAAEAKATEAKVETADAEPAGA